MMQCKQAALPPPCYTRLLPVSRTLPVASRVSVASSTLSGDREVSMVFDKTLITCGRACQQHPQHAPVREQQPCRFLAREQGTMNTIFAVAQVQSQATHPKHRHMHQSALTLPRSAPR